MNLNILGISSTPSRLSRALLVVLASIALGAPSEASRATAMSIVTSWFGNSFNGNPDLMQRSIYGLYVSPDGACFTNCTWDESHHDGATYKDGEFLGTLPGIHNSYTHGSRTIGGDDRFVFYSVVRTNPQDRTQITWCIGRCNLKGDAEAWPGQPDNLLPVNTLPLKLAPEGAEGEIWGIAADNDKLFVATAYPDQVCVYSENAGKLIRTFAVPHPGPMCADKVGNLWIIERPDSPGHTTETSDIGLGFRIAQYTENGAPTGKQIPYIARPLGMAIDRNGRLMVADEGPAQQILIYNIDAIPKLVATFGQKGGLFSGVIGEESPSKLDYPVAVGDDKAGDLFVASRFPETGCELREYSPERKLLWQLYSDQFMNCSDADPDSDAEMVYSPRECFEMDFSQSPGKEATLVANTVNGFKYPDDARLHVVENEGEAPVLRRISGRLYMYLIGGRGKVLIYVKDIADYTFRPCGILSEAPLRGDWPVGQPAQGGWLWINKKDDGQIHPDEIQAGQISSNVGWNIWVDSRGDIWTATSKTRVLRIPLLRIDQAGTPIYDLSAIESEGVPSPFSDGSAQSNVAQQINRIDYEASTDTMYITGYADAPVSVPNRRGSVFARELGPDLFCYHNWSHGNRSPNWQVALPYVATDETAQCDAMTATADVLFVGATGGGGNQNKIWIYSAKDGHEIGLVTPGANVGQFGWIDFSQGLRAVTRKNGEILLFVEDVWKEKQVMYRIRLPSAVD